MTTNTRVVVKFSPEFEDDIEQLEALAVAFGWTVPAPDAPATRELFQGKAAALRRAVAALVDNKSNPTLEQKEAIGPFLNLETHGRDFETARRECCYELCRWISVLEVINPPSFEHSPYQAPADVLRTILDQHRGH
jgi:hypothetical protein